ncbi:hypothetical protein LV89_03759 [Arcicella aurantiaca]|uniref:Uncharacterized protein n=1 Tax=Arcicella aurantiaca TaxID=591202 RepID=A0A316DSQ3_9BACT|nr:hypothetical protein [Arcicella aurantiaca]PWK20219.1 hypothetical protein LV89_03759 [Arcicella aurantiaca]
MKNYVYVLITYLFSNICLGQNANKIVNVKAKEINTIGILPIISSINILKVDDEKVSQELINETNSITNNITEQSLDSLFRLINLPSKKIQLDSTSMNIFLKDIQYYFTFIKSQNPYNSYGKPKMKEFLERMRVYDFMANVIKSNNLRYALCIVNNGFTRTQKDEIKRQAQVQKNNQRQAFWVGFGAIGGLIGALSSQADSGYQTYFATGTTSYAFLFDAETKKIVNYFINTTESDPINLMMIQNKQIIPLFNDFWVWYHPEAQRYVKMERK